MDQVYVVRHKVKVEGLSARELWPGSSGSPATRSGGTWRGQPFPAGGLGGDPGRCNPGRGYSLGYRKRDNQRQTPDNLDDCRGLNGAGKGI